jgi:hypothetical protein
MSGRRFDERKHDRERKLGVGDLGTFVSALSARIGGSAQSSAVDVFHSCHVGGAARCRHPW